VTRRGPLWAAGVALAAVAVLAGPSAAAATPVAVAGGTTSWTTGGGVAGDLARAGVFVRPGGVTRMLGPRLDMRITGGTTSTIEHGFGAAFVLRKGRRAVRVTELRVRLGRKARITGRLDDGIARTLFTLGRAELRRRDGTATSRLLRARLTAATARRLRNRLRVQGLGGGSFGTLEITARERRPATGGPRTVTTTTTTVTTTVTPPPAPAPTAGCPAPTAAPTGTPAVSGGTLEWGFKTTFRSYIRSGAAHGSIAATGGASETANGFTFTAPRGSLRPDGTGDARYAGTVYFEGHGTGDGALLRLWICRPRVVLTSLDAGVLRADVASRTLEDDEIVEYPNIALADLDLTNTTPTANGGTRTWTDVPTTLRQEGAGAFAGFYQAGQELDPLTFRLIQ
jgi:hypothetical protein